MRRKTWKAFLVIGIFIIALLAIEFVGWNLLPVKNMHIAVLDKTVASSQQNVDGPSLAYRKHTGLFWILNDHKYGNPATGQPYDEAADYFGPVRGPDGTYAHKGMDRLDVIPDLIYLCDTYGDENFRSAENKGITYSEIAAAGTARANGAMVIGQSDITSETGESVVKEIQSLFGIRYSGWVGRYFVDLADMTDVPPWAVKLHETEYGNAWDYTGSGMLLVSRNGQIVILQQGVDYEEAPLTIRVASEFAKQFGNLAVNYYNWFELVSNDYDTEAVAQYHFNLNQQGKQKFSIISDMTVFPAVIRQRSETTGTYYFAGQFSEYTGDKKVTEFLFSDYFYRLFSYDRPGDTTFFYWNFYRPVMNAILQEAYRQKDTVRQPQSNAKSIARIDGKRFMVLQGDEWQPFVIKGFNLNAAMPGAMAYDYTRDISIYQYLIDEVAGIGGNCIRVSDLMPPEFYRALDEHNLLNPTNKIFFLQGIAPPDNVSMKNYHDEGTRSYIQENARYIVDAVHGNATVPKVGRRGSGTYINDVSDCLLGYLVDAGADEETIRSIDQANEGYRYAGAYASSDGDGMQAVVASICDGIYAYQSEKYGYISPVGAKGSAALLEGFPWSPASGEESYDLKDVKVSGEAAGSFFLAYSLEPSDQILLNNANSFASYTDEKGPFAYGGYVRSILGAQSAYPVLIDSTGLSTHVNAFERETSVNGLSEKEQGIGLVRILQMMQKEDCLGALLSDLNDQWCQSSPEFSIYDIPKNNKPLWQNALDAEQNSGVIAVEPVQPKKIELSLKDTGLMSELQLETDAKYLYATVILTREINYDKEQLIIGLDTYQRNNGEYRYDPSYFATSLSGMEYIIKFESKISAGIYAAPSYNRNKGRYSSKESYVGAFEYIAPLTYGSFASADGVLYQTGSTIHIRIPWSVINFTDPSRRIVIDDDRDAQQIKDDPFGLKTIGSDGVLFSLLVADKSTKDTVYIFPVSKQSTGYKAFKWDTWSTPAYQFREKESYAILKEYFINLD